MTLMRLATVGRLTRGTFLVVAALAMVACAGEVDDTTGSRLTQVPPGTPPIKPTPAGDITIVGQEVAHAIMDLPEVSGAATPPLVQFTDVTSIIVSPTPIDTQPYTDLLRDRILLLTREKLRFVEKTLPPLVTAKKGKKKSSTPATPPVNTTNPDYQILAELRGHYDDELYKIQVEFVNAQTGDVLFNGLYSIRKEAPSVDAQTIAPTNDRDAQNAPPPMVDVPNPSPQPPVAPTAPTAPNANTQ